MSVTSWLLDSDPAIRWQVMRDITNESKESVVAERARVGTEGWGARLLGLQADGGYWGKSDDEGWMTTIYALLLLKSFGLDPQGKEARRAIGRVQKGLTWYQLDGRPFFDGETEPCLNGGILASGAYFGAACDRIVERLLGEQLEDGGWNCEAPASKRSSFHTTICVLEGLLEYEKSVGVAKDVRRARLRGEEYLLERRMFKSLSTGEVIDRRWLRFAFPPTWRYDILRGLDYLRSTGMKPDDRLADAVEVVRMRCHQNGRWPLNTVHAGRLTFEMEAGKGKASRWNTLRAMRVLKWYAH